MKRSTRIAIATAAGIVALVLEVIIFVASLGGSAAVPDFLQMLAMMSIVGIAIAGAGLGIGLAVATALALIVYLSLGLFANRATEKYPDWGVAIWLGFLLAGLFSVLGALHFERSKQADRGQVLKKDMASAVEFAERNPKVLAAAGGAVHASIFEYNYDRGPLPARYQVHVRGNREVYTVVYANRAGAAAEFTLRCVSTKAPSRRPPGEDECSP